MYEIANFDYLIKKNLLIIFCIKYMNSYKMFLAIQNKL